MDTVVQRSYPSGTTLSLGRHPHGIIQTRQQWVCWRYELIGRQHKKPPFHPRTGHKTDVTRPDRWGTYREALTAYKAGKYDGIGFVFLPSDPYTGIDLDHCIDPETGEIAAWARKIVTALNSYTEYSPGGDGLHILTKATLPDRGLKEGNIEVYSSSVYFTWTNHHLPDSPESIEERQERVTLLHDWLLLKRLAREVKDYTWGGRAALLDLHRPSAGKARSHH
jgi:primase-polymerase (primpol)-like protein